MGRGGTPARETSFVSLVAYGPNSDSALTMGVTASETRQGNSNTMRLDCELGPPSLSKVHQEAMASLPLKADFAVTFILFLGYSIYWKIKFQSGMQCLSPPVSFHEIITNLGCHEQDSGMGGASPHVSMETPILTTTCRL